MPMRLNGKRVVGIRYGGKNAVLGRLNGKVTYSTGLRSIFEEWATLLGWRQFADPANNPTLATLGTNPTRLIAGVPSGIFDGKATSNTITRAEVDNERGVWEVKCHTNTPRAGIYTGIILGCDDAASRMLVVEWESNRLVLRYRTAKTNGWVDIGANTSFRYSPGDTIRVERTRDGTRHRVRAYQNGVLRGSWVDGTGIPGAKNTRFIGVRLEGERNFFTSGTSPSIDSFRFTAG